jgi:hypothetical protein
LSFQMSSKKRYLGRAASICKLAQVTELREKMRYFRPV